MGIKDHRPTPGPEQNPRCTKCGKLMSEHDKIPAWELVFMGFLAVCIVIIVLATWFNLW